MAELRARQWVPLAWAFALALACAVASCTRREQTGGAIHVQVSFGEVGISPGQFSYPRCLDHDRESLWVIDKMARVQCLDPNTGQSRGEWRMPEWKDGKPTGVTAWEPEGQDGPLIFVPDTHYHRVMVYDGGSRQPGKESLGTLLTKFGTYGKGPGQFIFPTDVAVLPGADGKSIERLYVSEYQENDRISVYDATGVVTKESLLASAGGAAPFEFKFAIGGPGTGSSPEHVEFSRPQSLAIDARAQELIVTDSCNHRIGRFTLEGKLIAWISSPENVGTNPGQFAYPYGLALMPDGTALVAEFGNSRVQHVDLRTGASLGVYGELGAGVGQLTQSWGVTVMGSRVYVLDSGNNRIMGFEAPRARSVAQGAGRGGAG